MKKSVKSEFLPLSASKVAEIPLSAMSKCGFSALSVSDVADSTNPSLGGVLCSALAHPRRAGQMSYKDPKAQSAYQAGWIAGRRNAWLEANGPCKQCGSDEDLELDHIDPAEKVTHRVWTLNKADRDRELAKCQVLCKKCHREKTNAMLRREIQHGTKSGYAHYGCRCEDCTRANTEANRRNRAKWRVA